MNDHTTSVRPATTDDQKEWNTFVDHPLQTWQWGEFRKHMGIDVVRMVVERGNKISGCWQLTFHKIPFSPCTIGYFPKGPLPDEFMIEELKKIGKQKNAIYIQLEPNVIQDIKIQSDKDIENKNQISQYLNISISSLQKSHHPLFTKYTFVLDLAKSEEDLLAAMHPKTRYNIRLAQKHAVVVREDNSDEAFREYLKLSEETISRQGFYAHNQTYHQTMWNIMKQNGNARLFTATYNNEIITAWICFHLGETLYYPYGASSRQHREVMAPNLLLWEIVRWAKKKGIKKFDLWGAMGPDPDTNDPWYGFHRFKEGYSPNLVEFVGSYDLVIKPLLYRLYCLTDNIRWAILKFNTKL